MTSLISAENAVGLFAILCAIVAFAIWLEQKYVWASKMSGCIIVLLTTLILANLRVIPEDAPVYGFVGGYLVPMAIPLLLFNANLRTILKESGRLLALFLIGTVGTIAGALVAGITVGRLLPDAPVFLAMITGSYVGGGINFVAMAENYGASGTTVATANVADALTMMFFFFALMIIPSMKFFLKRWKHPIIDEQEKNKTAGAATSKGGTNSAAYWSKKEMSLKDLAFAIGIAAVVVGVATPLAAILGQIIPTGNFFLNFANALLGSKYLLITVFTVALATLLPGPMKKVGGTQEIGTYFIYMFFAVMSAPVSLRLLVNDAPIFFACCILIVLINIAFTLGGAKLLKFGIEEAVIASNANIGGATTAAPMAIAKGWSVLVVPAILVGTFGNVIGNIAGILVGTIFGA